MHRLLTGYSQYYNRRNRRVGHLLQGRHKAILCQSDRYLCELVRYIHLNPVRARMVSKPEQYPYSGHRAYLGLAPAGILDVDPVLRRFGAKKELAREAYRRFVAAGMKLGHQEEFYLVEEGRILGTAEFVDTTIHRIGATKRVRPQGDQQNGIEKFKPTELIEAVESICGISRAEFCGPSKNASVVKAKEMFIMIGWQMGGSASLLSQTTGISRSAVSRRHDAAKFKLSENSELNGLAARIRAEYLRRISRIAKSQA
jgi:hypothetical protein